MKLSINMTIFLLNMKINKKLRENLENKNKKENKPV
jgi:hypothetical protein